MADEKKYQAWIISDGKVGRRNQCIGVAQKLPANIKIFKIDDIKAAGGPKAFLATKFGRTLTAEDWPDVILSSGEEAGDVAIAMKDLSRDKVFLAAITNHIRSVSFDFMAAIHHTKHHLAGHNMEMIGVPHKVTREFIAKGVEEWRDKMQAIIESKKPILSVLVGGDINEQFKFSIEDARQLGDTINKEAKRLGAALLITNSPRISVPVWRELLSHATDGLEQVYVHDCRAADGNPFAAMLGMADVIAVTGDSISMCCEATATGKPVYIMSPPSITPELYAKIHDDLYERNLAKKFNDVLDPYEVIAQPLDEAGRVAKELSKKIEEYRVAAKTR